MSDINKINLNGATYNIKTDSSAIETDPTVPSFVKSITQQDITNWNNKSNFSGNYNDLTNKPTIPDELKDLTDDSTHRTVTDTEKTTWNNKSNFSGNYNDLTNKPTIPAEVTETTVSNWGFTKNTGNYNKPNTGIPKTDLATDVQTSLGKADTALQSETYTGTITGITMNGSSKGTSGVVDLGTVITSHQDISGKLNTSQVKNATSTTAGDVYDVRYINSILGDVNTALENIISGGGN